MVDSMLLDFSLTNPMNSGAGKVSTGQHGNATGEDLHVLSMIRSLSRPLTPPSHCSDMGSSSIMQGLPLVATGVASSREGNLENRATKVNRHACRLTCFSDWRAT
jgi:hypothetical protein